MDQGYYVYILRCADGTLYTGITTDLDRRIRAHNAGKGAKYTRARTPVRLAYAEQQADRAAASRREYAIKRLPRAEKEALIAGSAGDIGRSAACAGSAPALPPKGDLPPTGDGAPARRGVTV